MDGRSRIATIRVGTDVEDPTPATKFNLEDHLGTSSVMLDFNGNLINREEYYPFGETSFGAFAKKRYRYVGKEKDNESGLYYYGARYYAAWMCRFISVDPLATKYPQLTPYNYAANNPIGDLDIDGMQNTKTAEGGGNMPPPSTDAELDAGLGKPAFTNDLDPEGLRIEKQNPTISPKPPAQPANTTKSPSSDVQALLRDHPEIGLLHPPPQQQQELYATPKSAATSIKEGLNGLMAYGGSSAAVGLIGMAIYGTAEDAWIFAQGWGTGRPKDFEGWDVSYDRRVGSGIMTLSLALGPMTKAANALEVVEQTAARSNKELVQEVANRAQAWGERNSLKADALGGTLKHSYSRRLLERYQNIFGDRGLSFEVSYNKQIANKAGLGSIRLDVVEGPLKNPTAIFDYKFGKLSLTPKRIDQIQRVGGFGPDVPIKAIFPHLTL